MNAGTPTFGPGGNGFNGTLQSRSSLFVINGITGIGIDMHLLRNRL